MQLTIGQVSKEAQIAPSAIRYYESVGLIEAPERRSGRRVFESEVLDRLTIIELAKSAGFKIAEIRNLLLGFAEDTEPGERWRALATHKLEELDRRIEEAQKMKHVLEITTQCGCATFEVCAQAIRLKERPDRSP